MSIIEKMVDNLKFRFPRRSKNQKKSSSYIWHLLMSLVAHQFGRVEFWISNICCCFSKDRRSEKIITNIQNSTIPNPWAKVNVKFKWEIFSNLWPSQNIWTLWWSKRCMNLEMAFFVYIWLLHESWDWCSGFKSNAPPRFDSKCCSCCL